MQGFAGRGLPSFDQFGAGLARSGNPCLRGVCASALIRGLVWVAEAIDHEVSADNDKANQAYNCEKVCHGISVSGVWFRFLIDNVDPVY